MLSCRPSVPRAVSPAFAAIVFAGVAAGLASHARAQTCSIYLYEVDKNVSYTQGSNAAPVDPDGWYFHAGIFFNMPNVITAASLRFNVPPVTALDFSAAGEMTQQLYSPFYTTQAGLDAEYPSTTYTTTVECGMGLASADVFLPADLFCPEIPHFTGDTFDRLQAYDPTREFAGTVNGFTLAAGSNVGVMAIAISQEGVGGVFTMNFMATDTAFTVPANTLAPNANHLISVSYTCILHTPNAGFDGAASDAAFSRGTSIAFRTRPLPPACVADFDDGSGTGTPDGGVTIDDLLYYLTLFADGLIAADIDDGSGTNTRDGGVTIDDLLYFLARYADGC